VIEKFGHFKLEELIGFRAWTFLGARLWFSGFLKQVFFTSETRFLGVLR
jgi:hypothetical protein